VVGLLVHAHPIHADSPLAPPSSSPRSLHPDQMPQPPRSRARSLPRPQACHVPRRAHSSLWDRPFLTQHRLPVQTQNLLAQGVEVGHHLFLVDPFWHPRHRVLPAPHPPCGLPAAKACRPPDCLLPTQCQPRTGTPAPLLSLPVLPLGPDSSRALTSGLSSVYLPLSWKAPSLSPRQNPPPVDAVAHRAIPFTSSLSMLPMINSGLVPEISALLLPQSLMTRMYSALKKSVREGLIEDWSGLFPPPSYYYPPPPIQPHPFMGLNIFTAGRIPQMRAGKGYLATQPAWRAHEADTSCPRCSLDQETFEPAILACPSRQCARAHLLHGVTSIGQKAPLWSFLTLLKKLSTYLSASSTGFPPIMFPPTTPPSSRRSPFLPPTRCLPRFACFPWLMFKRVASWISLL